MTNLRLRLRGYKINKLKLFKNLYVLEVNDVHILPYYYQGYSVAYFFVNRMTDCVLSANLQ